MLNGVIALSRSCWSPQQLSRRPSINKACNDRRADFSPFVCSSDGAVHREGIHVLKRVAAQLAAKLGSNYSWTMSFVRQRLSVAILRASVHCAWVPEGSLLKFIVTMGPLCPFFFKEVFLSFLNFVCLDGAAHLPFVGLKFVFFFILFIYDTPFFDVFCCYFCSCTFCRYFSGSFTFSC